MNKNQNHQKSTKFSRNSFFWNLIFKLHRKKNLVRNNFDKNEISGREEKNGKELQESSSLRAQDIKKSVMLALKQAKAQQHQHELAVYKAQAYSSWSAKDEINTGSGKEQF